MEKYNAGYKIIEELSFSNNHYVLGHKPNAPAPYVTWEANEQKNAFFRGHYFADKESALLDLFQRAGKDLHLEGGKSLGLALLTEDDRRILREEGDIEAVCFALNDLFPNNQKRYEELVNNPDFMERAVHRYNNIDHSYENEAFAETLEDLILDFPEKRMEIHAEMNLSPEKVALIQDLLKMPTAAIREKYGPLGDSYPDLEFALENGMTVSFEILPVYDSQDSNKLSETEPHTLAVNVRDEAGNEIYDRRYVPGLSAFSIPGDFKLTVSNNLRLNLTFKEDESLRRVGNQFLFECSGGEDHIKAHHGELCTIQRALTPKECDILCIGFMWEAEFPNGDRLHVFDHELLTPARPVAEKLPLSKQIDTAQEKTKPVTGDMTPAAPER